MQGLGRSDLAKPQVANAPPPLPPPLYYGEPPPVASQRVAKAVMRGCLRLGVVCGVISALMGLISAEAEGCEPRFVPYLVALLCGAAVFTFALAVGWAGIRIGKDVQYGLCGALCLSITAAVLCHWQLPVQLGYAPGFLCAWGLLGFVLPYAMQAIVRWVASGFRP
jgi:hypothetical protein